MVAHCFEAVIDVRGEEKDGLDRGVGVTLPH